MLDHLEELRKRIILVLVCIAVCSVVCFYFSDFLLDVVSSPIKKDVDSLYFSKPYEAFLTRFHVCLVAGFMLSLPILFLQLWTFVSPGLYPHEKKPILPLVSISVMLFIAGILFCYYWVMPLALKFFLGFRTESLQPIISIGSYITFFLTFIIVFGLVFDLPVIIVGLVYLGVLKTGFLRQQRRIVIVLAFFMAAVLTPTVDMVTQCFLAVPLCLLYEISILIGQIIEKRRFVN